MEDMYNMRSSMQIHSYCSRVNCPMMVRQTSIPNYTNYNMNNYMYGEASMSCKHMHMYDSAPMRSTITNPYFFQNKMTLVPIEEIKE